MACSREDDENFRRMWLRILVAHFLVRLLSGFFSTGDIESMSVSNAWIGWRRKITISVAHGLILLIAQLLR